MWREIARPLIHGYNLNAVVPRRFGSAQILVASDEKLIRHFIMSRMVQESLSHLAGIDVSLHPSEAPLSVEQAYIPELGLSNKPKESMNSQEQKEQVPPRRCFFFTFTPHDPPPPSTRLSLRFGLEHYRRHAM
jgi:hypothetical protein